MADQVIHSYIWFHSNPDALRALICFGALAIIALVEHYFPADNTR